MKFPSDLFTEALRLPDNALIYEIAQRIRRAAHDLTVLQTQDYDFQPVEYAESAGCALRVREDILGVWNAEWLDDQIKTRPVHAAFDVGWRGETLTIVRVKLDLEPTCWVILAKSISICERFFVSVCQWYTETTNAITVFDQGSFCRDEELRESISGRLLEDLVLSEELAKRLQTDVLSFFDSKELYQQHRVPWKRGVILHGPPGNGKTQVIRAMINATKVPVIYVRSLVGYRVSSEMGLRAVYTRARSVAPAIVVLEDLDTLITSSNRSYFLNEIDGLNAMDGVMTIATTNHLDRLDVAIKDRPSRFDVKLEFGNPKRAERHRYLQKATSGWSQVTEARVAEIAKQTSGYSFASLQELCRSAMMQLLTKPTDPFDGLLSPVAKGKKSDAKNLVQK